MQRYERPVKVAEDGRDDETWTHPSYGAISLTTISGGNPHLFGSDVQHGQRVRIQIKRAEHRRSLSNDWHFTRGRPLVELEMSHAQFAEFITAGGRGEGIACTLLSINGEDQAGIEPFETKQEMFRREIEQSARRRLDDLRAEVAKLGAMIESGKFPKADMRALHRELDRTVQQLPGSLSFVVGQAEEALEKATTAARISIEATVNHHINRIGLDAAQAIGLVPPAATPKELDA